MTKVHHLDSILDSLEDQLGVNIVIHDNHAFFCDLEGVPLISRHRRHDHDYCNEKRFVIKPWDRRCLEECQVDCQIRSEREMLPWVKDCWKGVREVCIPLISQGIVQGVMHVGPFRSPVHEPPKGLELLHKDLPELEDEALDKLIQSMGLIAKGMIYSSMEVKEMGDDYSHKRCLEDFLHARSHERININDIAELFNLSASRTSHIIKKEFGTPFVQLLQKTRVNKSKFLLLHSSWSIAKVANQVGFESEYYFSRIFKKIVGQPPGKFRTKRH
jgi:AraC-like DNA-binding protein